MRTTWIGQTKVIVRGARYFRMTEVSSEAAVQAEWADGVLAKPATTFPNGCDSHEVAGEALDRAEDVLIDYLVVTT